MIASVYFRHHLRRLSLFGSTLKGTNDSESDVDLLVEFEPGYTPGFIKLAGMDAALILPSHNRAII